VTSVGRRAYLVKYFKEALGDDGQVHASNSSDLTIAFQYADKCTITPPIFDCNYISFLVDYCANNKISAILSLFDIDLLVISENKDRFEEVGTRVILSDSNFIRICNDKWRTQEYLRANGFFTPKTYITPQDTLDAIRLGEMSYPVMVKPRFGCGSIATLSAKNETELCCFYDYVTREISSSYLKFESAKTSNKVIFQEVLGGQEYGVDIINDLTGAFRSTIIRKKIAMRAGETDIAEIVENEPIYCTTKKLGEITGHIGNVDSDIFLVDGDPYILEMNARFGGGYPFSHAAGCNLPKAIIKWAANQIVPLSLLTATPGIIAFKDLIIAQR